MAKKKNKNHYNNNVSLEKKDDVLNESSENVMEEGNDSLEEGMVNENLAEENAPENDASFSSIESQEPVYVDLQEETNEEVQVEKDIAPTCGALDPNQTMVSEEDEHYQEELSIEENLSNESMQEDSFSGKLEVVSIDDVKNGESLEENSSNEENNEPLPEDKSEEKETKNIEDESSNNQEDESSDAKQEDDQSNTTKVNEDKLKKFAELSSNGDKYKSLKYLNSENYFSNKEIEEQLFIDLNKEDCDVSELFSIVLESNKVLNNYNALGLLFYIASIRSDDLKANLYNVLENKDFQCIYFYASKYAIRFNKVELYRELIELIKASDSKSIYLDLLQAYHKAGVYTFALDDRSYKSGVKFAKVLKKKGKSLKVNELNALYMTVMEGFGNPYNEDIKKGMKLFKSFESEIETELKVEALALLGDNYIIHYEFDKAKTVFEKISNESKNWFLVLKNMLLINNKVRTYEDLVTQTQYKDSEDYKRLENTSLESDDLAIVERFKEFEEMLGGIQDLRKERLFASIRKAVYVLSFVFYFMMIGVNHYIKTVGLMIFEILCALAIMGITLLRTDTFKNIKKYLTPIIVFGVIGVILIVLAIVL